MVTEKWQGDDYKDVVKKCEKLRRVEAYVSKESLTEKRYRSDYGEICVEVKEK